jgi:hypothetical protein
MFEDNPCIDASCVGDHTFSTFVAQIELFDVNHIEDLTIGSQLFV